MTGYITRLSAAAAEAMIDLPYVERRAQLKDLGLNTDPVRTPPWYRGGADDMLAVSLKYGLEGVVGKPLTSRYYPGQRRDWLLYVEGLATHGGPESCVDDPRGRGEALTGHVQAGLSSRGISVPGCRRCPDCGRQHRWRRYREPLAGPAWSKNQGMYGTSMRENRESPCPPAWLITGRAAQGTPRR